MFFENHIYFTVVNIPFKYFSKYQDEKPTIVTTDPSYQERIGTATRLSKKDIQLVNALYRCSGKSVCHDMSDASIYYARVTCEDLRSI